MAAYVVYLLMFFGKCVWHPVPDLYRSWASPDGRNQSISMAYYVQKIRNTLTILVRHSHVSIHTSTLLDSIYYILVRNRIPVETATSEGNLTKKNSMERWKDWHTQQEKIHKSVRPLSFPVDKVVRQTISIIVCIESEKLLIRVPVVPRVLFLPFSILLLIVSSLNGLWIA